MSNQWKKGGKKDRHDEAYNNIGNTGWEAEAEKSLVYTIRLNILQIFLPFSLLIPNFFLTLQPTKPAFWGRTSQTSMESWGRRSRLQGRQGKSVKNNKGQCQTFTDILDSCSFSIPMSMTRYMFTYSMITKNRFLTSLWRTGRSRKSPHEKRKVFLHWLSKTRKWQKNSLKCMLIT